ncbi:MAG: hypothetical protein V1731_03020 [Candidatus Aenigmatarchaeota archaeon]
MEKTDETLFLKIKYSFANSHASFSAYAPKGLDDNDRRYVCDGMLTFGCELAGFLQQKGVDSYVEPSNNGTPGVTLRTKAPVPDMEAFLRKAEEVKYRIVAHVQYNKRSEKRGVSTMTDRDEKGVPEWHKLYEIELEEASED